MASQQLANLFPASRNEPTLDKARIKRLRAAVATARYRADPLAIADALLRFEQKG